MMDKTEISEVVAYVMEGQGREVSRTDLELWSDVIGDLPFSLARDAARALLREADRFIAPATVRQRAVDLARDRIRSVVSPPQPPSGLSPEAYERWLAGWRHAAMVGEDTEEIERAGLAAIGMRPQDMPALTGRVPELSLAMTERGEQVLTGAIMEATSSSEPVPPPDEGSGPPRPLF